jgi:integrase
VARKLEARDIERLPAPETGQVDYFDRVVKRFALRVTYTGTRNFVLFYRSPVDGKRRRIKIGEDYPLTKLAEARELAQKALLRIKVAKQDPAMERAVARNAPTLKALAELFLSSGEYAAMAASTRSEILRIAGKDLIPQWGDRKLSTIERLEVKEWGERLASSRGGYIANRTYEYMRLIWHWGLAQPDLKIVTTPFINLSKPFKNEAPRERILSNEEIRKVFDGILEEPRITAAWWIMLFLTAARSQSEAMRMEKTEIDREKGAWIIPKEKTKPRRMLVLPLSQWALEVLDHVWPLSGDSPFVFPSPKEVPSVPKSITSARRAGTRLQERTGIEFQIRDIRRTVSSIMGQLGIEPHVIDRIQNHKIPNESGVTRTYQTHLAWSYFKEKREALEAWSRHLDEEILKGKGREITRTAITLPRDYEGWNAWSAVGHEARAQETWKERKARLGAEGRDLLKEHTAGQRRRRERMVS